MQFDFSNRITAKMQKYGVFEALHDANQHPQS
jgi:hypothetical protein